MKKTLGILIAGFALAGTALAGPSVPYGAPATSLTSPEPVSLSAGDNWVPLLQAGTKELSLSGQLNNIDDWGDLEYQLDLSYGYFIADGWEVGITADLRDINDSRLISVGLFTEYNFNRTGHFVPFIGAAVQLGSVDLSDGVRVRGGVRDFDDEGLILEIEAGVKYFFRPNIAITASISFEWSSEDIYAVDDNAEDAISNILIGMRYYF